MDFLVQVNALCKLLAPQCLEFLFEISTWYFKYDVFYAWLLLICYYQANKNMCKGGNKKHYTDAILVFLNS